MEWTNEKYLNFIEDYKHATVLWDIRNPNYKNNGKKRKVLRALGQKYGMDEASLRKKIKNLRSGFHREHHRLAKIKGEDDDDGVRKWFAYDALTFILDVSAPFTAKRAALSFSNEDSFQHDEPADDESFDVTTQYIQVPQLVDQPEQPKSPENFQKPTISKEEDEYDLFGRSMTMQLRKLPELTALELMQKMQFMVFNARKQLSKERNKRKIKMSKREKQGVQSISTSKKKRTSSPISLSSPRSNSPSFKFETLSPEADTTRACVSAGRDFTYEYVTTVEDVEHYVEGGNAPESSAIKQQLDKPSKSIDPLEVIQSSSSSRIKQE